MPGSERRSLLDGEISRREATAKDTLDQFLGKLVDAFNFQIQEQHQQLESARRQQEQELIKEQQQQQRIIHEDAQSEEPRASVSTAPAPVKPTKSSLLFKRLSEKLSEFVLNETIDQAVKENPMEPGWTKKAHQRSSWFDDLRDPATLSSEKDLEDNEGDDDENDMYFQTDDEASGYGNYQIMT